MEWWYFGVMEFLRRRRLELGLSQAELAQRSGVARQRIAEIEGGLVLPGADQAEALEEVLGCQGLATSCQILSQKWLGRQGRRRPFEAPEVNQDPWLRAERYWAYPMRRIPVRILAWMKHFFLCDEASECYGWVQLAMVGARPRLGNPHQAGFRNLPLVDGKGQALGERMLPCLHWKEQGFECILWPQVRVRPLAVTYRLDSLLFLRKKRATHWLYLELDGRGHDEAHDLYRHRELKLDAIRVPAEEVKRARLVGVLRSALLAYPG
jgi:transcriptional regulator with XRE-family HTH domain